MGTLIARFLGLVLIAAAVSKGLVLADWRSANIDSDISSGFTVGIAQFAIEFLLGTWLTMGWNSRQVRWIAIGAFIALSAVAASKGIRGLESCGCAGRLITVSPWSAFTFDLGAMIALWCWQPRIELHSPESMKRTIANAYIALSILLLAVSALGAAAIFDDLRPSGITVKGQSDVTIDHPDRSLPLECTFTLHNPTSRLQSIRRVHTGCARVTAVLVDPTISAGQDKTLVVRIGSFDDASLTFFHRIKLETDSSQTINLFLQGTLPVSQTAFYRPRCLYLTPDEAGNWPERTVRLRLPKKYMGQIDQQSLALINCVDSKAWLTEHAATTEHFEYTVHLALASTLGTNWQGGKLMINTKSGDITIPLIFQKTR